MKTIASLTAWCLLWEFLLLGQITAGAQEPASVEYFEKHIRPVLVEKCYACHAAEHEINGGLSLDSRPGWIQGGDSGPAIVPGKPENSRLIEALEYKNSNLQMPPEGKLPSEVIQRFKDWIAAGATDPREQAVSNTKPVTGLPLERASEHWAYRPIVSSAVPEVGPELAQPGSTPLDNFVNRQVQAVDLTPAAPADQRTLVRRLYFDLHGLPPTEIDLQAFVDEKDPEKYSKLVERLLASPRFGERMARRWMDVARYAESVTLRGFILPQAWRYRDYLITAFNEDRSLAEMIQEQVAGDLLDHPESERRMQQVVATTFLAMGNTNLEEQDKTQLEMDYIDEQLDVIGKAFMGQTIGCARCHDHKFDPISTRDYYALAGIFRSTRAMEHDNVSKWIERPLPLHPADQAVWDTLNQELESLKREQAELEKLVAASNTAASAAPVPLSALTGVVVDDSAAQKVGNWKASTSEKPFVADGYVHDLNESQIAKTITFEPKALKPGTYSVRLAYTASGNRSTKTSVRVFSADGENQLTINQRQSPPIHGLWINLGEYRFEENGQAFVLISNENADGHVIADAVQFLPVDGGSNLAAATADKTTIPTHSDAAAVQSSAVALKQTKEARARLEKQLAARPLALGIIEELPPRDVPIHIRGSVHNLGPVVPRGFLQLARLNSDVSLPENASGRKELAQWLTDARHPLTPRVISNRLWAWIFGSGVVRTVDNFGTTGEAPVDGQLLDYLATELLNRDWSAKAFVRQLVLSDAYRRSSVPDERATEIDPENRYFSHAWMKRLDVEAMRDAMLSISGELLVPGPGSTLRADAKEDYRYRHQANLRAVYLPVLRNSLPELFEAFDFPNSSVSTGVRSHSTVAPQALAMLNSPWVLERARVTGERLLTEPGGEGQADQFAWPTFFERLCWRALGRAPSDLERYTAATLVEELQQQKLTNPEIAARLVHGVFASLDFRYLD